MLGEGKTLEGVVQCNVLKLHILLPTKNKILRVKSPECFWRTEMLQMLRDIVDIGIQKLPQICLLKLRLARNFSSCASDTLP